MTEFAPSYYPPPVAGTPPPPRNPRGPWAIAAALCAIAVAAVVITVPAVRAADRPTGPAGPQPLAPGIATFSNERLAELLPQRREFPPGWTAQARKDPYETFGYYTTQPSARGLGIRPADCFAVIGGAQVGDSAAADVSGHDPADPPVHSDRRDIRLRIGREYNPVGFDDMIALVSRCLRFTANPSTRFSVSYSVRILESSRPAGGPEQFRYALTTQFAAPGRTSRSEDYFSYARMAGLVLSGSGSDGHQQIFDATFAKVLNRIRTAAG